MWILFYSMCDDDGYDDDEDINVVLIDKICHMTVF